MRKQKGNWCTFHEDVIHERWGHCGDADENRRIDQAINQGQDLEMSSSGSFPWLESVNDLVLSWLGSEMAEEGSGSWSDFLLLFSFYTA